MHASLVDLSHPLVWTVDDALSAAECSEMVAHIEAASPELATIDVAEGHVLRTDIRNNSRVTFDDVDYATRLFSRIRQQVPASLMGMERVGANERLRCYRYAVGQRFAPHYDGSFARDENERSLLTLMVYLNDDFEGGATSFLELDKDVTPKRGTALLFQHAILHEGCVVTRGVKYALRSDVMYRRRRSPR